MKDWKSTAAGILSFLTITLTTISGVLAGNDLSAGGGIGTMHTATWVIIAVNVSLAVCRAWVGWLQRYVPIAPPASQLPPSSIQQTKNTGF